MIAFFLLVIISVSKIIELREREDEEKVEFSI